MKIVLVHGSMRKLSKRFKLSQKLMTAVKDPLTALLARNELFKVFDGLETRQSLNMFLLDITILNV